jgi:hypothetical protein
MINRDIAVKLIIRLKRTSRLGSAGIARQRRVPHTHARTRARAHTHTQMAVARAVIR